MFTGNHDVEAANLCTDREETWLCCVCCATSLHSEDGDVAIPSAMKRAKSIMLINAVLQYSEKHQYRI